MKRTHTPTLDSQFPPSSQLSTQTASQLFWAVDASIRTHRLLPDGQRVLVAVSGGLDSVVLLRVLHTLAPRHGWKLVVAHFNHQLRGAASHADERFVRALARELRRPFVCARWPVGPQRGEGGSVKEFGLEMAARLARHQFLADAAARSRCPAVALAHHEDDQLELFFLRLLRGAGGEGLGGMKWATPGWARPESVAGARVRQASARLAQPGWTLVRPLLDQSRNTLEACAWIQGWRHREDASNLDLQHDRNWVRHELLPRLARRFRQAPRTTILRSMELVRADSQFVQSVAEHWLASGSREPFEQLHPAVQRQVLRGQLRTLAFEGEFDLVEHLRLHPEMAVTAPGGRLVRRDADGRVVAIDPASLEYNPSELQLTMDGPGSIEFDGVMVRWRLRRPLRQAQGRFRRGPALSLSKGEVFDADRVGSAVRLRHWRPGDRFQPIGMAQATKLQDLFTNLKVPAAMRRQRLVAEAADGQLFWVEGVRLGENYKLTPRTRRVLEWRWQR